MPALYSPLRRLLLTTAATAATAAAWAQLPYPASNAQNTTSTYADLGAAGTVISTGGNFDEANSAPQNIGFSFGYNGQVYTQFVLNTNGFLKLGAVAPAGPFFSTQPQAQAGSGGLLNSAETNLLLPFNTDLMAGSAGAEYRVAISGAAPSRVCTIQWKNVQDKPEGALGSQYNNFSFQVRLYEGSNQVEYVYGPAVAGAGPAALRYVIVALKGNSNAPAEVVSAGKNSADLWSLTSFRQGDDTHNVRSTTLPDPGRTYRFVASVPNDAAVYLYSFDQVAVPQGSPLTLRARVGNSGTTALSGMTATLRVSGVNNATVTAAVPALAPGAAAVVSFPPVALAAVGANVVTVTLPADGNGANNESSLPLQTSATTFSSITPGLTNTAGIVPSSPGVGYAVKFTLSTPGQVTAVRAYIASDPVNSTAGQPLAGVVVDRSTGAILARSADFVPTAADLNTVRTFQFSTPAVLPAGDFLVGMVQSGAGTAPVSPFGVQNEPFVRPDSFFRILASGGSQPFDAQPLTTGKFMFEAVLSPVLAAKAAGKQPPVQVFPNPSASGRFELELSGSAAAQPLELAVRNLLGQPVYRGQARVQGRTVLDLSQLPAGVYLLQLGQGPQSRQQRLVIGR